MSIEVGILISVIGVALSAATFFIGRQTAAKNSGKESGVMLTEIGYIKSGIDDMKHKLEQSDKHYNDLDHRVTKLEQKMAIYHHGGE